MTIQEMFEREDIYSIIERTLPEYYHDVFGKDVTATVKKGLLGGLCVYPRIGVIIPVFPSARVIREVFAFFDVQKHIGKRLVARLYITLCLLTFGAMAHRRLFISDRSVYNRDTMIVPSNRKIRFYYFDKLYIDSIIKDGFNDFYFHQELYYRERLRYPFILRVDQSGERWYRERCLSGRPLVRMPKDQYARYLNNVLADLNALHSDTARQEPVGQYCSALSARLLDVLDRVVEKKNLSCGARLRELVRLCRDIAGDNAEPLTLALAHGDLQTGNIHIDEEAGKEYIVDWETGGEKSVWYDAATVLLATRRKGNFSSMINKRFAPDIAEKILCFDARKTWNMDVVAAVLLLEELGFFLDEIIDFPGRIGVEVIDRFIYELNAIEWGSFRKG